MKIRKYCAARKKSYECQFLAFSTTHTHTCYATVNHWVEKMSIGMGIGIKRKRERERESKRAPKQRLTRLPNIYPKHKCAFVLGIEYELKRNGIEFCMHGVWALFYFDLILKRKYKYLVNFARCVESVCCSVCTDASLSILCVCRIHTAHLIVYRCVCVEYCWKMHGTENVDNSPVCSEIAENYKNEWFCSANCGNE